MVVYYVTILKKNQQNALWQRITFSEKARQFMKVSVTLPKVHALGVFDRTK